MVYVLCAVIFVLLTALGFLIRDRQRLRRSLQISKQQLRESQIQQDQLTEALQQQQLTTEAQAALQDQIQSELQKKLEPLEIWEEELSKQQDQLAIDLAARQALTRKTETLEASMAKMTRERDDAKSALNSLYEQLTIEIDREVTQKTAALNQENQALRDRNQQLQAAMTQIYQATPYGALADNDDPAVSSITLQSEEPDLYQSERQGIILDLLEQATHNYQQPNRRLDIIADILKNNQDRSERAAIKDQIKQLFTGYRTMDAQLKSKLSQIGFEIYSEKNHYKLHFRSDPRYPITFSKTSSDSRVGYNIVSQIARTLL